MVTDERVQKTIDLLSSLIVTRASWLASEQHAPGADVDRSDDKMRADANVLKELREIRERFENIMTGVV